MDETASCSPKKPSWKPSTGIGSNATRSMKAFIIDAVYAEYGMFTNIWCANRLMSPTEDIILFIDAFVRKLMANDTHVAVTRTFGPFPSFTKLEFAPSV